MSKVLDVKCPSCQATLHFDSSIGKMKCEYCGTEIDPNNLEKATSVDFTKEEKKEKSDAPEGYTYVSYNCPDCGAEIVADEQTSATFCLYCGSTAILKDKLSGKFKPDLIIPFKTEKKLAIEEFKKLKKGRPFVPASFVNEKNIEKIRGLYVPFWLYQVGVSGMIKGEGINVTTWTRGDTHYTKKDYYNIVREGSNSYSRVPVDGSTRFDNDIMNTIEPFKYEELVDFNPAYLSGFLAEKYDVSEEEAFKDAADRSVNSTKDVMLAQGNSYTTKTITSQDLATSCDKTEYALLPVWMVNVKYNDKYYIFAMNGQTGEFIGNIPLDKKKATIWFICIFAAVFALVILISYLIYMGGAN